VYLYCKAYGGGQNDPITFDRLYLRDDVRLASGT
jgi:hypothetical protein